MGQVRTKPPMSMRKFWQELADLPDKGWKTCLGADDEILLDPSGMGIIKLNPIMAVACANNKDRIPVDLDEACRILNLSFRAGQRIREASINYGNHRRTRRRLLRALGLKPSTPVPVT